MNCARLFSTPNISTLTLIVATQVLSSQFSLAQPLGTSFTYQGRLNHSNSPVSGVVEFRFTLWDAASGGNQIGSQYTVPGVAVTDGFFTTSVDFGDTAFNGQTRYLQIAVRQQSGIFTTLSPRQVVSATPNAIGVRLPLSESASSSGSLLSLTNTGAGAAFNGVGQNGYAFIGTTTGAGAVTFRGSATNGYAFLGTANGPNGIGVAATHEDASGTTPALYAVTNSASTGAVAMLASVATTTAGDDSRAVWGINSSTNGIGVYGQSISSGWGVYGASAGGIGVRGYGEGGGTAIFGAHTAGPSGSIATGNVGVSGANPGGNTSGSLGTSLAGVKGVTNSANLSSRGIEGTNTNSGNYGLLGTPTDGVYGLAGSGYAVRGQAESGVGVAGFTNSGTGVQAHAAGDLGNALVATYNGIGLSTPIFGNIAIFKNSNGNQVRINNQGRGYFNGGTQTGGADLAEAIAVEGATSQYEPGDVLVISLNGDRTVARSAEAYCTRVAGVLATKPGVLLTDKHIDDLLEGMVPMGVVGIIPTKVSTENGPIQRGDLLVSAATPGHAMKATDRARILGAIIGKSMQNFYGEGTGVIEVMVNVK